MQQITAPDDSPAADWERTLYTFLAEKRTALWLTADNPDLRSDAPRLLWARWQDAR
jgi:hypothetical protein